MRRLIPILTAALLVPIACDDSPTTVADEPPPEAMLATFASLSAGPDGTYPCPDGGEISRTAEHNTVIDAGTITTTYSATMVHTACAVRIDELLLTSDGTLSIEGISRYEYDGESPGALLESTSHQTGSMRIRTNEGYDRTCDMDLTVTTDPLTNVRRLTGTLCGSTVDFEIDLP